MKANKFCHTQESMNAFNQRQLKLQLTKHQPPKPQTMTKGNREKVKK